MQPFLKKQIVYFAWLFLLISSCTSKPSEQEKKLALEQTVMQVHDEAMSKMETAYQLRTNFKKLQKQMQEQKNTSVGAENIHSQILLLEQAEEAMVTWMHQYRTPENQPVQQATSYLQQQLTQIRRVKNQMDQTLVTTQKAYQQYEKK